MPRDHEYPSGHKTPKESQQKVLTVLASAGWRGLTAREIAMMLSPGNVSAVNKWGSCITVLRRERLLVSLTHTRERHHVAVLPEWVKGRETWDGYHHTGHCETCTCFDTEDEETE